LLLQRRANVHQSNQRADTDSFAAVSQATTDISESTADTGLGMIQSSGRPTTPSAMDQSEEAVTPMSSFISAEALEAENEASLLAEELQLHEEQHMRTLRNWVQEYHVLAEDIGHGVIERAQGYYDSQCILQQASERHAKKQEEVDNINCELEKATINLERVEEAFEAFVLEKVTFLTKNGHISRLCQKRSWRRPTPMPS